jgi:hypothetical protein
MAGWSISNACAKLAHRSLPVQRFVSSAVTADTATLAADACAELFSRRGLPARNGLRDGRSRGLEQLHVQLHARRNRSLAVHDHVPERRRKGPGPLWPPEAGILRLRPRESVPRRLSEPLLVDREPLVPGDVDLHYALERRLAHPSVDGESEALCVHVCVVYVEYQCAVRGSQTDGESVCQRVPRNGFATIVGPRSWFE